MRRIRRKPLYVAAFAGAATIVLAGTVFAAGVPSPEQPWPYASASRSPVLAAVGDIGCEPNTPENQDNPKDLTCAGEDVGGFRAEYATATQIENMQPDLVALLGDEQYQVGKLSDFENSFDKTYGAPAQQQPQLL